ncbi:MAG TPA: von Willebrand factor type A domain-containing protein [Kofleriaceae bacterium]|nr:von Willebrand factor type A domain-containing protein [Kofleriaceae bacterium]
MRTLSFVSILAVAAGGCAMGGSKKSYVAAPPESVAGGMPSPGYQVAADVAQPDVNTEQYTDYGKNPWVMAEKDRFSTFAADVDTASYTIGRRKLTQENALPPQASVRVEEWVNYFHYSFPPAHAGTPFATVMEAAPHPFAQDRYVLRVGVATKAKTLGERKPAALVFLVDVSGSMSSDDKLGLAKKSLHLLTENLTEKDAVSIVTYAGDSRVVLPMTSTDTKEGKSSIHRAIDSLGSGGSTAMASGIDLAYEQAAKWIRPGAISRVIVLTDGDANVGSHTHEEMLKLIEERAQKGVALSTIGFGMGNYKDTLMEQLADKGNGNNYYVDSFDAAKRIFGEQVTSTLEVAAKDVKLQVEFDPAQVARYRLVGYENRDVKDEDFRKDEVTGGQVGWGHQVTAMYEVELTPAGKTHPGPLGAVRIRHKQPEADKATEDAFMMAQAPAKSFADASADFRFAFSVAAFADVLRAGATYSLEDIRSTAAATAGDDKDRNELLTLIDRAIKLNPPRRQIATDAQVSSTIAK